MRTIAVLMLRFTIAHVAATYGAWTASVLIDRFLMQGVGPPQRIEVWIWMPIWFPIALVAAVVTGDIVTYPFAMLTVAYACLLTALLVWQYRHKVFRRSREGFCAACGYDLRASPQRCPECGRAAAMRNAERGMRDCRK
jgi:hypothetical protein